MAAVGAVLLGILKVLGILLAAAAALLLLLLLLPASVWVDYSGGQLTVKIGMLFVQYQLLPQKPKKPLSPEQQAARLKKQQKKAAKKKKPGQKPKAKKTDGEKLKLTFDQICAAAADAGHFLKAVLGGIRVTHIRIRLPVTGSDAADTAILYGKTQAWLHGGLAVLNRLMWLDFDECRLEPDYTGKMADITHCSCKISARLIIIGIAGIKLFMRLKDEKILDALL